MNLKSMTDDELNTRMTALADHEEEQWGRNPLTDTVREYIRRAKVTLVAPMVTKGRSKATV